MEPLTEEEMVFLDANEIPLSRVFDAAGLPTWLWKQTMSTMRLWVAYGVSPCQRAEHRLRTRKGHCAQCNPAAIAFLKRHDLDGIVYAAYSHKLRLIKVGCTTDIHVRQQSLRDDSYGGASDWSVRYFAQCERAGRVEFFVHRRLSDCRRPTVYHRISTMSVVCANELFRCSLSRVHTTLNEVLGST